jgi:hypothetical protein
MGHARAEGKGWLVEHVLGAKDADYAARMLRRVALGIRAGGAIRGVRVLVADDACPTCRALADIVYDPADAPLIPIAGCTHAGGCRCAYATVMLYEGQTRWAVDHRPKRAEYGSVVLERLRLGARAQGAIRGVRVLATPDACETCRMSLDKVWLPHQAPHIPITGCTRAGGCRCAYFPLMAYAVAGAIG